MCDDHGVCLGLVYSNELVSLHSYSLSTTHVLCHTFPFYSIVLYYSLVSFNRHSINPLCQLCYLACLPISLFLSMFLFILLIPLPIPLSFHLPYSRSLPSFSSSLLLLLFVFIVLACPSSFPSSSPFQSIRSAVSERRGIYWSRSRGGLWRKGDTSGMHQVPFHPSYSQIPSPYPIPILFLFSTSSFLFSALFDVIYSIFEFYLSL